MQTKQNSNMAIPDFSDAMIKAPVMEGAVYQVPVAAGKLLRELANLLYQGVNQISVKELPITEVDIVDAFEFALAARCAYVSGVIGTEPKARDIRYPSLLFPILSAVGRCVDTSQNLSITPIPAVGYQGAIEETVKDGLKSFQVVKGRRLVQPENYEAVMNVLNSWGVSISIGLPMDKDVLDDELYRLDVIADVVYGGVKAPSVQALYARTLLELQYLGVLYGQARVMYVGISSMRQTLMDFVARQIRGPSTRIA